MFVAMFVIGAGLTKTKLIDHAQNIVIRYKENPRMLIFVSLSLIHILSRSAR